jgi:hypothetical protein
MKYALIIIKNVQRLRLTYLQKSIYFTNIKGSLRTTIVLCLKAAHFVHKTNVELKHKQSKMMFPVVRIPPYESFIGCPNPKTFPHVDLIGYPSVLLAFFILRWSSFESLVLPSHTLSVV